MPALQMNTFRRGRFLAGQDNRMKREPQIQVTPPASEPISNFVDPNTPLPPLDSPAATDPVPPIATSNTVPPASPTTLVTPTVTIFVTASNPVPSLSTSVLPVASESPISLPPVSNTPTPTILMGAGPSASVSGEDVNNDGNESDNDKVVPSASGNTSVHRGVPAGTIVGVVVTAVILLLVLGVFLMRRRFKHKRIKLRGNWIGKASRTPSFLWIEPREKAMDASDPYGISPYPAPTPRNRGDVSPGITFARAQAESMRSSPSAAVRYVPPPPPPRAYQTWGGPSPYDVAPASKSPSLAPTTPKSVSSQTQYSPRMPPLPTSQPQMAQGLSVPSTPATMQPRTVQNLSVPPTPALPLTPAASTPALPATPSLPSPSPSSDAAIVWSTFIPTLPDELSIVTGETIRVISEYDDGWALCSNARGEMGMIPLECLGRAYGGAGVPNGLLLAPQDASSRRYRTLSRASSLAASPRSQIGRY